MRCLTSRQPPPELSMLPTPMLALIFVILCDAAMTLILYQSCFVLSQQIFGTLCQESSHGLGGGGAREAPAQIFWAQFHNDWRVVSNGARRSIILCQEKGIQRVTKYRQWIYTYSSQVKAMIYKCDMEKYMCVYI